MAASAETVESVVTLYHEATEANRATAVRQGNVVVLSPKTADDVMITADLHGNRQNFNRLLELAELGTRPCRHLIMQEVCHGGPTYPAGGCMSHLMLEDVARLKTEYPQRFHFLLSNHELAELTDFPIMKAKQLLNLQFRCGLDQMYGSEAERVREAAVGFIGSCPLAVKMSNGVFISHSAPEHVDHGGFDVDVLRRPWQKEDLAETGGVFRLVWGRDFRPENAEAFARAVGAEVLIHGHEPCAEGFQVPNHRQVILDCCGEPACYVVLSPGERLSQQQIVQRIQRIQ